MNNPGRNSTELFVYDCGDRSYFVHDHEKEGCPMTHYVKLDAVVEALERGYAPQNPSDAHPADYITKWFKGVGHEGLRC